MTLYSEIFEQPDCIEKLLQQQRPAAEELARAIRQSGIRYVFLAARGTSDNAGRYANYLWAAFNGLPLALATPSLFTLYQQPPSLEGALVVGISQSGQSPDIVAVLEEGRKQGCLTLAITNEPNSPLAKAASHVLDIQAGPERAVAATKTYTAELACIAMISAALNGAPQLWEDLYRLPGWAAEVLQQDAKLAQFAQRYRYMQQCVVLGRGFNYATAFEWALKMKELTYVEAEPYSSADFMHGPIAMVAGGFPVMAVAPQGKVLPNMLELLGQLRNQLAAELVIISNENAALGLAQTPISIPAGIPEWLTPIIAILPAQLFAHHLTGAKGYDTETPRTIRKVTETK